LCPLQSVKKKQVLCASAGEEIESMWMSPLSWHAAGKSEIKNMVVFVFVFCCLHLSYVQQKRFQEPTESPYRK
jgi:hypothetical protein